MEHFIMRLLRLVGWKK